jgi:hypothetical protein
MSSGLRDALGWWQPPPASSASTIVIPGLQDDTEEIPLFTPAEWAALGKDFGYGESRPPYWSPVCECGSDKAYGPNNKLHVDYCPKYRR